MHESILERIEARIAALTNERADRQVEFDLAWAAQNAARSSLTAIDAELKELVAMQGVRR